MTKRPIAHLERYQRVDGRDSAYYVISGGRYNGQHIVVVVGWALLGHYLTTVTYNTMRVDYHEARYVQPPEALRRLDFSIDGEVDFADPETFRWDNVVEREASNGFSKMVV